MDQLTQSTKCPCGAGTMETIWCSPHCVPETIRDLFAEAA